ncbi:MULTISPECIES: ABC transporter permease subunit [unclassified Aureispira]|uniref:ABC transporter permease subunit n=1 Tax=unclassified Aureispira TaxID=2649989 RepID=UPI000698CFD3|nr:MULTISPECIES: ABC transporter permease [unclassified Aureispira]WMX14181.1 ABC transporter permease subunit [Aureispira sp. CCB-E]
MFQYIIKRILIFIPTFFVISLLIFGLSKMAPGDPVLVVMGGNDSNGVGQRSDLVNGEKAYAQVAASLGLDKPAFYFLFTSAAYPTDLYTINKRNHRETISRLIDEYGNSAAVMDYYETLKAIHYKSADVEDARYSTQRTARNCINDLFNEYEDGAIQFKLNLLKDSLATPNNGMESIREDWNSLIDKYNYLKNNPTRLQLYLPAVRWYGLNSQYHTWMFGDYPWFSKVDSSSHYRIEELSTEITDLVPQKRRLNNSISKLRGRNYTIQQELDSATTNANPDSLRQVFATNELQIEQYLQDQEALKASLNVLSSERDSLSANLTRYASKGFLRGDFGLSYIDRKQVSLKMKDALYWTLIMNFFAILISYLISIPLGVKSALWKLKGKKVIDNINTAVLFILYSLPSFWIGTILLVFFTTAEYSELLDWFPTSGAQDLDLVEDPNATTWMKFWDAAHHLALPIFCITYGSFAYLSRQMRGSMLGVIRQDYIRTARAKGLSERKVVWKHAFRNSLFPIITLFSSVFPRALSGSIAIELIYAIPGMGQLVLMSITSRDWPVVFTIVMFAAILTMIGNLIADILYAIVDPRVSFK